MKQLLTSKKGITFMALFITLLLGITIGTIIPDGVSNAQDEDSVELLQIQGEGSPLLLDESVSLTEGFARVASTVTDFASKTVGVRSMSTGVARSETSIRFCGR